MVKISMETALISCKCAIVIQQICSYCVNPDNTADKFYYRRPRYARFTHVSGLCLTFSDYFRLVLFDFQIRSNRRRRNHAKFVAL